MFGAGKQRAARRCPSMCPCIILLTSLAAGCRAYLRLRKHEEGVSGACVSHDINKKTHSQLGSQDANINRVYLGSFHFLGLFCLNKRRIQANKVSLAPNGGSKQKQENNMGYISSLIHLITPMAHSRSGNWRETPGPLLEHLIGESGFPKHPPLMLVCGLPEESLI